MTELLVGADRTLALALQCASRVEDTTSSAVCNESLPLPSVIVRFDYYRIRHLIVTVTGASAEIHEIFFFFSLKVPHVCSSLITR